MKRLRSGLDRIRRRILWHRRLLAALAAAAAVWLGVQAAMAPTARTVPVWTLASRGNPGDLVRHGDLRKVGLLPGTVPAEAITDPRAVIGRPLAHAVAAGQVLTDTAVLGKRWVHGQGGLSVVPVRITDPAVVPLLRTGDEVDLYATDVSGSSGAARVVAHAARVVSVPKAVRDEVGQTLPGRLILVGVSPEQVGEVTRAAAGDFLSVAWRR